MVTRAAHLVVVSDYSSQTFLLAFRRFVSRRGFCSIVYSDNGTTFQEAEAELKRLFSEASETLQKIANTLAVDGVEWRFIPPRAPHFGGLWEAGVKAFKRHLRRVLGEAKLTYEEFHTLTTQIEACLNSRPLSPLSADPLDVTALTPAHFLVGSALTAVPEPVTLEPRPTCTAGYRITLQMRDCFWKRWQREVLQHLQHRNKWHKASDIISTGDLVLITDDILPPSRWPLARVIDCHQRKDGLISVLTLKTAT